MAEKGGENDDGGEEEGSEEGGEEEIRPIADPVVGPAPRRWCRERGCQKAWWPSAGRNLNAVPAVNTT